MGVRAQQNHKHAHLESVAGDVRVTQILLLPPWHSADTMNDKRCASLLLLEALKQGRTPAFDCPQGHCILTEKLNRNYQCLMTDVCGYSERFPRLTEVMTGSFTMQQKHAEEERKMEEMRSKMEQLMTEKKVLESKNQMLVKDMLTWQSHVETLWNQEVLLSDAKTSANHALQAFTHSS